MPGPAVPPTALPNAALPNAALPTAALPPGAGRTRAVLTPAGLHALVALLVDQGRRVIGPIHRDSAIVLAEITSADQLPRGIHDEQSPGHYRTRASDDEALFAWATPAQSAKPFLFPPDELLWRGRRTEAGPLIEDPGPDPDPRPLALFGLRGCDLAAIGIHDHVLAGRAVTDTHYAARRADVLLVAVTCGTPAGTCFCASMGTGPKPGPGADLTLTELADPHRFLAEPATPAGDQLLETLADAHPGLLSPASPADLAAADEVVTRATASMGRTMDTDGLPEMLLASAESHRWDDVASRCLACTNCTAACPTCFCTTIDDVSDLSGALDERHRVWDSCFSMEYSRLHGGAVRTWVGARYRQWLTHKLATWHDQFGSSGCVGCGRCITWCPAGIDLTAEVAALRELATAREALAAGSTRGPRHPRTSKEP